MSFEPVTVVFGTAAIGSNPIFGSSDIVEQLYTILNKYDIKIIDSAQLYGDSEAVLGKTQAGKWFTIDSKWYGGFKPGNLKKENVIATAKESIERLKVKQVDVFYIHKGDDEIPIEETLEGVNEVYKAGLFKRFGLSNYIEKDVQKIYDTAKVNGFVLPTVYQGNYNPVARAQETRLLPTLRKLNIAFYAYSPLAGGFLTKTVQQIKEGAGRFNDTDVNGLYKNLYSKPALLDVLAKWDAAANEEGVPRAELAYRWVASNSFLSAENGDAIVVGASSIAQLEQTLASIRKGKLSDKAVEAIDRIWEEIKHEAPLDNFNS
jgi:aflatoxin B1 aldehyde reductase